MAKRIRIKTRPSTVTDIVLHRDPEAVRAMQLKAYRRELANLNKASERLRRYVEVDQPAFSLWWQQEFALVLSKQIDLEKILFERELLIDATTQYKLHYGIPYAKAIIITTAAQGKGPDALRELMQKLFDEMDAKQKKMKGRILRKGNQKAEEEVPPVDPFDFYEDKAPSKTSVLDRDDDYTKKIYKELARLLHPDASREGEQSALEKSLWHELQNAYEWRDIARMEAIGEKVKGSGSDILNLRTMPIGDIVSMKQTVMKDLKKLTNEMRDAKESANWDFTAQAQKKGFLKRMSRAFEDELDRQTEILELRIEQAEMQIEDWLRPKKR